MAKAKRLTDEIVESFTCGKFESGSRKGQRKDQDVLWDIAIKGFGMRYSSKTETRSYLFRYRRPTDDREVYIHIGRHGAYTADGARAEAKALSRMVEDGKDPVEVERQYQQAQRQQAEADRAFSVTLRQMMEHYLEHGRTKHGPLRPATKDDYRKKLGLYVGDWLDKPMVATITRDACLARFTELSDTAINRRTGKPGKKGVANFTMTYLRRLCNHAAHLYESEDGAPRIFAVNPVNRMVKVRKLNPNKVRTERIPKDRIGAVWNEMRRLAVWGYHEDVQIAADWLSVVMLTGTRLTESAALIRANVDLKAKTLHIPGECDSLPGFYGTKNHKNLTLPLPSPLVAVLERRVTTAKPNAERPYEHLICFPSNRGEKVPYVKDPRSTIDKLSKVAGVHLSCHSFRRTFEDILRYAKVDPDERRLILNHISGDVHQASYSNSDNPETLRDAMDAAAAWVMEQSKIAAGANIIAFPQKGARPQTVNL